MPTAAQAAQQLTPAELGQLQALTRLAVDMVRAVARSGSGFFIQGVLDYQVAWNGARYTIDRALQALGSEGAWFHLVEDGQYGPNTSTALWTTFSGSGLPRPPRHASGLPAYYTTNRSLIEGLVPPTTSVAEDILNAPVPAPPAEGVETVPAELFEAVQNSSGSLVQEHIAVTTNAGEAPVSIPGAPEIVGPSGDIIDPWAEPAGPPIEQAFPPHITPGVPLEPLETELVTEISMAETPIVGTPRQGGVPMLALAAGVTALGGVFWWWTKKGRRG